MFVCCAVCAVGHSAVNIKAWTLIIICCSVPNWLYVVSVQPDSDRIFSSTATQTHRQRLLTTLRHMLWLTLTNYISFLLVQSRRWADRFVERTEMKSVILLVGSVLT